MDSGGPSKVEKGVAILRVGPSGLASAPCGQGMKNVKVGVFRSRLGASIEVLFVFLRCVVRAH